MRKTKHFLSEIKGYHRYEDAGKIKEEKVHNPGFIDVLIHHQYQRFKCLTLPNFKTLITLPNICFLFLIFSLAMQYILIMIIQIDNVSFQSKFFGFVQIIINLSYDDIYISVICISKIHILILFNCCIETLLFVF